MPRIARVEPLTTARALRGPFDYLSPDGVQVGSLLVVPFGHRDVTGVVTELADHSEVAVERLATPRRVLPTSVPPDLIALAEWMAGEYVSTFARSLQLMLPPGRAREKTALWADRTAAGDAVLDDADPAAGDPALDGAAPPAGHLAQARADRAGADRKVSGVAAAIATQSAAAGGAAAADGAAQAGGRVGSRGRAPTARQRELLASLPRLAGPDLAALRRLERRGWVTLVPRAQRRAPAHVAVGARRPQPALTAAQAAALDRVEAAAPGERMLLHGVTGSGKTEVYLRAVGACLERGEGAIVLVPEIALTPQIVSRFVERFGDTVAVLHSALSDGERHDEWLRLRRGEARVCVGPRSAVFAPIERLGLIVVDEEHDPSYKNEGDPRYDARLVAERRGCRVLAGSATPRPESFHAMRRLVLAERVDGQALPPVEVLDMREQRAALHPRTFQALLDAPKSIVLLNRRGWSNFLSCRTCGRAWECPSCDVTLVLHRAGGYLACHHCGHRERVPDRCPSCGSVSVARHGAGTERLESELGEAGLPVLRLDADVARAGDVLRAFERAERAVLVGTQVVAKGHDFPDVALGVVLDADATLRFPDFRAEERTFALVAQLAGRAGRGSEGAMVLVQTLAPDAASIRAAALHDSEGFLAGELRRREALRYPPFSTLIRIVCSSERPGLALEVATAVRARLPDAMGPAPLFRLRNRERAQVVLKAADRRAAIAAAAAAVRAEHRRGIAISVDVDPQ